MPVNTQKTPLLQIPEKEWQRAHEHFKTNPAAVKFVAGYAGGDPLVAEAVKTAKTARKAAKKAERETTPEAKQAAYKIVKEAKAAAEAAAAAAGLLGHVPPTYSFLKVGQELYAMVDGEVIGEGGFGRVKLIQTETGDNFAVKIEGRGLRGTQDQEYEIMKTLNFVHGEAEVLFEQQKEYKGQSTSKKLYTIMDYIEGKELTDHLFFNFIDPKTGEKRYYLQGNLDEQTKCAYAREGAKAIAKLHQLGIIHADIKPPNFMANNKNQVITVSAVDFGLSLKLKSGEEAIWLNSTRGTTGFIAPEINEANLVGAKCRFSLASDIYALGILFKKYMDLKLGDDFYKKMLSPIPAQRPNITEVRRKLHEYALCNAAIAGNKAVMKQLLAEGAEVDAKGNALGSVPQWAVLYAQDNTKSSALHWAASNNNKEAVKLLLDSGAKVDLKDEQEATALHEAAYNGHIEMVRLLLARGASIIAKNKQGKTAFDLAKDNGHDNVIKLFENTEAMIRAAGEMDQYERVEQLLAEEAEIDARNRAGFTALQEAIFQVQELGYPETVQDRIKVVELLINKGASLDALDKTGNTAMHWAASEGETEVIKLLLAKSASVDVKNNEGKTALDFAEENGHQDIAKLLRTEMLFSAAQKGDEEVVKRLLAEGAEVDAKNDQVKAALAKAKENGYHKIFQILSTEALCNAARNGNGVTVRDLLAEGAVIGAKNIQGETALQLAQDNGHKRVAAILQKNLNTKLIEAAVAGNFLDVMHWLANGAQIEGTNSMGYTALHGAAEKGNILVVGFLLSKGALVDNTDLSGCTALYFAVKAGNQEVVRLLLEAGGAKIDAGIKGNRPIDIASAEMKKIFGEYKQDDSEKLFNAASQGDVDAVERLLADGAKIGAKNSQGKTALQLAQGNGHQAVVELLQNELNRLLANAAREGDQPAVEQLLADGAQIDAKNTEGFTALHEAVYQGHEEIVNLLLNKGALVDEIDSNTRCTALYFAVEAGNEAIVRALLKAGAKNEVENQGAKPSDIANGKIKEILDEHYKAKKVDANKESTDKQPKEVGPKAASKNVTVKSSQKSSILDKPAHGPLLFDSIRSKPSQTQEKGYVKKQVERIESIERETSKSNTKHKI